MNISGNKTIFREFAAQNFLAFTFSTTANNNFENYKIGVSGDNSSVDLFSFKSGNIYDFNLNNVWSYSKNDSLNISGNIGSGYINYYINGNPICLFSPHSNKYYNKFYISNYKQDQNIDFDVFIKGDLPEYEIVFPDKFEFFVPITGYIVNKENIFERSFKIFSGNFAGFNGYFTLGDIDTNNIYAKNSGYINLNFASIENTNISIFAQRNYSANLTLNTNFGTITKNFVFTLSDKPIYFVRLVTGVTGTLGGVDTLDLSNFYNLDLQTIFPLNEPVTFILKNVSGNTGQKFYSNYDIFTDRYSGIISNYVYGQDYLTGIISGSGLSADGIVNFYGDRVSGIATGFYSELSAATGFYTYQYKLPVRGAFATGVSQSGTQISGFGIGLPKDISDFIFREKVLISDTTGTLTGYFYDRSENIQQNKKLIVKNKKYFTGISTFYFKDTTWRAELVSGQNYYGIGNRIIGPNNSLSLNYETPDKGINKYYDLIYNKITPCDIISYNTGFSYLGSTALMIRLNSNPDYIGGNYNGLDANTTATPYLPQNGPIYQNPYDTLMIFREPPFTQGTLQDGELIRFVATDHPLIDISRRLDIDKIYRVKSVQTPNRRYPNESNFSALGGEAYLIYCADNYDLKETGTLLQDIIPQNSRFLFTTGGYSFIKSPSGTDPRGVFLDFDLSTNANQWFCTDKTGFFGIGFPRNFTKDRKVVTHYELDVNYNSNLKPDIFQLEGSNNNSGPWNVLDYRDISTINISNKWNLKQNLTYVPIYTALAINEDHNVMVQMYSPVGGGINYMDIYTGNLNSKWVLHQSDLIQDVNGFRPNIAINKDGSSIFVGGNVFGQYPDKRWRSASDQLYNKLTESDYGLSSRAIMNDSSDVIIFVNRIKDVINIYTGNSPDKFPFRDWNFKQQFSGLNVTYGDTVAINSDASIIMVDEVFNNEAGFSAGAIYIYTGNPNNGWDLKEKLLNPIYEYNNVMLFGGPIINRSGNVMLASVYDNLFTSGSYLIYTGSANSPWKFKQRFFIPSNSAINFNNDGSNIFVHRTGISGSSFVDIYTGNLINEWKLETSIDITNPFFPNPPSSLYVDSVGNNFTLGTSQYPSPGSPGRIITYQKQSNLDFYNYYNSPAKTFTIQNTGSYNFLRLNILSGSRWLHLNREDNFFCDYSINKLKLYTGINVTNIPLQENYRNIIKSNITGYEFYENNKLKGNIITSRDYSLVANITSGATEAWMVFSDTLNVPVRIYSGTDGIDNYQFVGAEFVNPIDKILTGFSINFEAGYVPDFISIDALDYDNKPIEYWRKENGRFNNFIGTQESAFFTASAGLKKILFNFKDTSYTSKTRFFPCLGTSDYNVSGKYASPYLEYFKILDYIAKDFENNSSNSKKYYEVKIGPCHFFVLDSDPVTGGISRSGIITDGDKVIQVGPAPGDVIFSLPGAGIGEIAQPSNMENDIGLWCENGECDNLSNDNYIEKQKNWFNQAIKNSQYPWKFVLFNHPPYTSTLNNTRYPGANFAYGYYNLSYEKGWRLDLATAVFNGKSLNYERFKKDHDGKIVNYFVNGAGGIALSQFSGVLLPNSQFRRIDYGFTKIEVYPRGLKICFVNKDNFEFDPVYYGDISDATVIYKFNIVGEYGRPDFSSLLDPLPPNSIPRCSDQTSGPVGPISYTGPETCFYIQKVSEAIKRETPTAVFTVGGNGRHFGYPYNRFPYNNTPGTPSAYSNYNFNLSFYCEFFGPKYKRRGFCLGVPGQFSSSSSSLTPVLSSSSSSSSFSSSSSSSCTAPSNSTTTFITLMYNKIFFRNPNCSELESALNLVNNSTNINIQQKADIVLSMIRQTSFYGTSPCGSSVVNITEFDYLFYPILMVIMSHYYFYSLGPTVNETSQYLMSLPDYRINDFQLLINQARADSTLINLSEVPFDMTVSSSNCQIFNIKNTPIFTTRGTANVVERLLGELTCGGGCSQYPVSTDQAAFITWLNNTQINIVSNYNIAKPFSSDNGATAFGWAAAKAPNSARGLIFALTAIYHRVFASIAFPNLPPVTPIMYRVTTLGIPPLYNNYPSFMQPVRRLIERMYLHFALGVNFFNTSFPPEVSYTCGTEGCKNDYLKINRQGIRSYVGNAFIGQSTTSETSIVIDILTRGGY